MIVWPIPFYERDSPSMRFSRPGIFSRKFKQEFGSPPSEYRKKVLNEQPVSYHWKIPLNERSLNKLLYLRNKNKWLGKLFVIVIDNLDNELFSLELLSRGLFMSSSSLNRKVQNLFSLSTMKLVRDVRLQISRSVIVASGIFRISVGPPTGTATGPMR